MCRRQNQLFLLGSGQDLVEVDRDAKGDKEEAADTGADPVRGLEGWRSDELGPQGGGALGEEEGVGLLGGVGEGEGGGVDCVGVTGEDGVEVGFGGGYDF